jgi:hypothetical protein
MISMEGLRSRWPFAIAVAGMLGLVTSPSWATHFRYGQILWEPGAGANEIEFRIQTSWRRDAYNTGNSRCIDPTMNPPVSTPCTGADGNADVGDVIQERQGETQFDPGEGALIGSPTTIAGSDALLYLVTSVSVAENFVFAVALDPGTNPQPAGCGSGNAASTCDVVINKTYSGPGAYTATIEDCCRTSPCDAPTAHINNGDNGYRVATTVDVGSGNSAPVSSLPPVLLCPINGLCEFTVPVSDNELNTVSFRLSTSAEAGFDISDPPGSPGQGQPGTAAGCASDATIDSSTGLYSWNTIGCTTAGDPGPDPPVGGCADAGLDTCYSSQVIIEETDGNATTALDFFICLVTCPPGNSAPAFDPPSPCGQTLSAGPGQLTEFTIGASDADMAAEIELLNVFSLPVGATMTPGLPLDGNPVSSDFAWTPGIGDLGQHVMTFGATDSCGAQTTCTVTIDVSEEDCTNGIDDDGDGDVDCADADCDGVACDDTLACTVNDVCDAGLGLCVGATNPGDDGNDCTQTDCSEPSGCDFTPEPAGTSCTDTDADPCTIAGCDGAGTCDQTYDDECQPVRPILECVQNNGDGTFLAHFGYDNENAINVNIPIGSPDNFFTPSPEDRGQPEDYLPGRSPFFPNAAFQVPFDGSPLVWSLTGPDDLVRTATASSNPSEECQETEPITPLLNCVEDHFDGTFTARFGYFNQNDVVVTIPVDPQENFFSPAPEDRGQTTSFQPGLQQDAFSVLFDGSGLTWTLEGPDGSTSSALANDDPVRRCVGSSVIGLSIRKLNLIAANAPDKSKWVAKGELDTTTSDDFLAAADNGLIVIASKVGPDESLTAFHGFRFLADDCRTIRGRVKCLDPITKSKVVLQKRTAENFFKANIRIIRTNFVAPDLADTPLTVSVIASDGLERRDPIGDPAVGGTCKRRDGSSSSRVKCVDRP